MKEHFRITADRINACGTVVIAIATLVLAGVTVWYASLTHRLELLQVDPVLDLAIGQPFGSSTTLSVRNSGSEPIIDVAANLRCFLMTKPDDLHPGLLFEGFPSIGNANSWWAIHRLDPGATRTNDAREALVRFLHNKQTLEQQSATRPVFVDTIVAVDIVYQREVDHKRYHMSGIARLMKDSKTGKPFLEPLPMSDVYRRLLETVSFGYLREPSMK